jgi:hypothetical protein
VWTTPLRGRTILDRAQEVAAEAQELDADEVGLPWIDNDLETTAFVDRWFAPPQRRALRQFAAVLDGQTGPTFDACRLALSRTVITKDRGASLARDVSHSRPHRFAETNDFDVFTGFARAAALIAKRLDDDPPGRRARVALGDARDLAVEPGSIDAVVTSPPYLNAIDYMRGHRMSLVWLGYALRDLRSIRSAEIGTERAAGGAGDGVTVAEAAARLGDVGRLPERTRHILERYVLDLRALLRSLHRVVKPGGNVVLVVGNSSVRGVFLRNDSAVVDAGAAAGFTHTTSTERSLPENRRYLPPPSRAGTLLDQRMRTETVIQLVRP